MRSCTCFHPAAAAHSNSKTHVTIARAAPSCRHDNTERRSLHTAPSQQQNHQAEHHDATSNLGRRTLVNKPLYMRAIMRMRHSDELTVNLRTQGRKTQALLQEAMDSGMALAPHHWHLALFHAARAQNVKLAQWIWRALLNHGTPLDELMHATIIATFGRANRFALAEQYWKRLCNSGIRRTALSYDAVILAASCTMRADRVAAYFSEAREVDPSYTEGWLHLMRVYAWMGNPFACVAVIEDMAANGHEITSVHLTKLMRALSMLGLSAECDRLHAELQEMPDYSPKKVTPWVLRSYAQMGEVDKVRASLQMLSTSDGRGFATAADDDNDDYDDDGDDGDAGAVVDKEEAKEAGEGDGDAAEAGRGSNSASTPCQQHEHSQQGQSSLTLSLADELPLGHEARLGGFADEGGNDMRLTLNQLTLLLQAYAMAGNATKANAAFNDISLLLKQQPNAVQPMLHFEFLAIALAETGRLKQLSRLVARVAEDTTQHRPSQRLLNTYLLAQLRTGDATLCENTLRWARRRLGLQPSTEVFAALQALRVFRDMKAAGTLGVGDDGDHEGGGGDHEGGGGGGNDGVEDDGVEGQRSGDSEAASGGRGAGHDGLRFISFREMMHLDHWSSTALSSLTRPPAERMIEERMLQAVSIVLHDNVLTMRTLNEMCERQLPVSSAHFEKVIFHRLENAAAYRDTLACTDLRQLMVDAGVSMSPRAYGLLMAASLSAQRLRCDGSGDVFEEDNAKWPPQEQWLEGDNSPTGAGADVGADVGGGSDSDGRVPADELETCDDRRASDPGPRSRRGGGGGGAGSAVDGDDRVLELWDEQATELAEEFFSLYGFNDAASAVLVAALIDHGCHAQAWEVLHHILDGKGVLGKQVLMRACLSWTRQERIGNIRRLVDLAKQNNFQTDSLLAFLLSGIIVKETSSLVRR